MKKSDWLVLSLLFAILAASLFLFWRHNADAVRLAGNSGPVGYMMVGLLIYGWVACLACVVVCLGRAWWIHSIEADEEHVSQEDAK